MRSFVCPPVSVVMRFGLAAALFFCALAAVAQTDLRCKDDVFDVAQLPEALRAEAPIEQFADRITISLRDLSHVGEKVTMILSEANGSSRIASVLPSSTSTTGKVVELDRQLLETIKEEGTIGRFLPSSASARFRANAPTLGDVLALSRTGTPIDMRISGPRRLDDSTLRIIPGGTLDDFGASLPRAPEAAKPPSQTSPWIALSSEEIARRGSSHCNAEAIDKLTKAELDVTKKFGIEPENAASEIGFLSHARTDNSQSEDRRAAAQRYISAYDLVLDRCTTNAAQNAGFSTLGLNSRMGVLQRGSVGVCTTLLLGPRHVLTARHCLFDERTGAFRMSNLNPSDLWIALDAPSQRSQICAISTALVGGQFGAATDYLLLRIANTGRKVSRLPLLTDSALREGLDRPTELISFSYFAGSAALGKSTGRGFVEYSGTGCLVFKKRGQCYYHGCAAQPGSSGAPLFERESFNKGKLVLVGLHIGSATSTPDCPVGEFDNANVGNMVPLNVISPFIE